MVNTSRPQGDVDQQQSEEDDGEAHVPQPPRKKTKLDRYKACPKPQPQQEKKEPCHKAKAAAGSKAGDNRPPKAGSLKPPVVTAAASATSAASAASTTGGGGGGGSSATSRQQEQQQRLLSRLGSSSSGSWRRCLNLRGLSAANGDGGGTGSPGTYGNVLTGVGGESGGGGGGGGDCVPGALALDGGEPFRDQLRQAFQGRGGGGGSGGGVPPAAEPPHPRMLTRSHSYGLEDWVLPADVAKDGEDSELFEGVLPEVLSSPLLPPPRGSGAVGPLFAGHGGGGGGGVASAAGLDRVHEF